MGQSNRIEFKSFARTASVVALEVLTEKNDSFKLTLRNSIDPSVKITNCFFYLRDTELTAWGIRFDLPQS